MKKVSSALLSAAAILAISLPIAYAAVANITKVVFTTDVQTIDPGTASKVITIQTQNSSGAPEQLDDTSDVSLTSSSPTGEFSSSNTTWKAVSTLTMSKGSANRSFYYKNPAAGDDTLTVSVKARISGTSWSASQVIHIGTTSGGSSGGSGDAGGGSGSGSGSDSSGNATSTSTGGAPADSAPVIQYSSSAVSSHSDPDSLSDYGGTAGFVLGAGRDRLALAGSQVEFRANLKGSGRPSFSWSFGDGAESAGAETSHAYYYAGMYDVVLHAESGAVHGTARTKVRVVEPSFALSSLPDGGMRVTNNSAYEANISGWQLVSGSSHFAFPRDTIIAQHSSIAFPAQITGIPPGYRASLQSPLGPEIAAVGAASLITNATAANVPAIAEEADPSRAATVLEMKEKLALLAAEVGRISAERPAPVPADVFAAIPAKHAKVAEAKKAEILPIGDSATASVFQATQDPVPAKAKSPWTQMKDYFADWF